MHYFSGLFDAEGYVTLNSKGGFMIAIEMANQNIPQLFKQNFDGIITTRIRNNRKKTYSWSCNSNEGAINFIENIIPYSIVKKPQLLLLQQYLSHTRHDRSLIRKSFISSISACKIPTKRHFRFVQIKTQNIPNENFIRWLCGFLDGDGNFVLYETCKRFNMQVCAFNIFPEPIKEIKSHFDGSICLLNRKPNPIWKWTANNLQELLPKLLPHLIIKKTQCEIMIKFMENRQPWSYSEDYRQFVRDLILQLKHENSI